VAAACVINRRVVRDIASFVLDLLDVGYETASNLLSNGAIQLLSSDSWDTLSDSPEWIAPLWREIRRYDPRSSRWLRLATRTSVVSEVQIRHASGLTNLCRRRSFKYATATKPPCCSRDAELSR
jgi:hypothetical protein